MTEGQDRIQKMIDENESRLLELTNSPASSGWQGSDPEEYFATVEVSGHNVFHRWDDESKEYHYLPGFGFKFTIVRGIISPFSRSDGGGIFFTSSNMTSGVESAKTKLWLHLPDKCDFFNILNAIRAGDRFAPFQVRGNEEIVTNLNSPNFLKIAAYVEGDEVHAAVENILTTDIETIIESFIKIYAEEIEKFRTLKPHYQETDADGTRLWTDQGLQSKEYYNLRKKLGRKLLGRLGKVLEQHKVKYKTSWGLITSLNMLKQGVSEYGWLTVFVLLADALKYKLKNIFKSYEELRKERLDEYKKRQGKR